MKKLTTSALNRAKGFLASEARKLECHLLEFQFRNSEGAEEEIVEELKKYQNLDGSWSPSWSWDTSYPESWKRAEKEWKGVLTLAMLRSLRDYARVDGYSPRLSGYKYHID